MLRDTSDRNSNLLIEWEFVGCLCRWTRLTWTVVQLFIGQHTKYVFMKSSWPCVLPFHEFLFTGQFQVPEVIVIKRCQLASKRQRGQVHVECSRHVVSEWLFVPWRTALHLATGHQNTKVAAASVWLVWCRISLFLYSVLGSYWGKSNTGHVTSMTQMLNRSVGVSLFEL